MRGKNEIFIFIVLVTSIKVEKVQNYSEKIFEKICEIFSDKKRIYGEA